MSESLNHHCALAGMRAREDCQWNVTSVIEALIREQWNRGGAGWGLRGVIGEVLEAEAGGKKRTTLSQAKQKQSRKEEPVTTAVGHGSYVTSGEKDPDIRQPFEFEAAGMRWSFAFNGNLANYPALKGEFDIGEPDVDTEAIRRLLEQEINQRAEEIRTNTRAAMAAVFDSLEKKLDGCFNIVMINEANQLFAYRDHQAMRPIVWTKTRNGDTLVASEDSAIRRVFRSREIENVRHLGAGQLLISDANGEEVLRIRDPELAHCFFEGLYFARDLSNLDGQSVTQLRRSLGQMLALAETGGTSDNLPDERQHGALRRAMLSVQTKLQDWLHSATGQRLRAPEYHNAICFGVPKSGTTAGIAYAESLGIPYVQAVERRDDSDRSFTKGTQADREEAAEEKFLYHPSLIQGKDVYLVEDSVVRGTTMKILAQELRDAGAKSIHLRVTCPAVIGPCFYGIDFPTIKELLLGKYREAIIANGWKLPPEAERELAEILGVDSIKFLSVDAMLAVFEHCGIPRKDLCTACIKGTTESYPTAAGQERFELAILGQERFGMTGA